MRFKFLLLALISGIILGACEFRVAWQPPILPIKLVFSQQGVAVELEVGVDIPYVGRLSVESDLYKPTSLLVRINEESHQYDLKQQSGKKFEGVICETKCKINIELLAGDSILLDVQELGSFKNTSLVPNPGNFNLTLIVNTSALNIRSGPGVEYSRVGVVSQGEVLKSDGSKRNAQDGGLWYRVIVPPGGYHAGKEGWVNSKHVSSK